MAAIHVVYDAISAITVWLYSTHSIDWLKLASVSKAVYLLKHFKHLHKTFPWFKGWFRHQAQNKQIAFTATADLLISKCCVILAEQ